VDGGGGYNGEDNGLENGERVVKIGNRKEKITDYDMVRQILQYSQNCMETSTKFITIDF
jgi:hypothetical protein